MTPEVRLVHVTTPAERSRWRAGFIGAYQAVFARAPFFERFSPAEAESVWRRLTTAPDNITLVAIDARERLVGFGIGVPLARQHDVARELTGLVSVPHTFYFAELGVLPTWRSQGIARSIVRGAPREGRRQPLPLRGGPRAGRTPRRLLALLGPRLPGHGRTHGRPRTSSRWTGHLGPPCLAPLRTVTSKAGHGPRTAIVSGPLTAPRKSNGTSPPAACAPSARSDFPQSYPQASLARRGRGRRGVRKICGLPVCSSSPVCGNAQWT